MSRILISPFARALRNGQQNAKNYSDWKRLIYLLNSIGTHTIQIGLDGEEHLGAKEYKFNLNMKDLKTLTESCDTWISVDNFFQHFAHHVGKPGTVIWGPSNPRIFGYEENFNVLTSYDALRPNQFDIWDSYPYNPNIFPSAPDLFQAIKDKFNLSSLMVFDLNDL